MAKAPAFGTPGQIARTAFGCRPEDVAEDVILTPFVPLRAFERHLQAEGAVRLSPPFFYRGLTASFLGHRTTVLQTGVGPSRVGDCLGFLAVTGARRVLFAGAVGSLHPDHALGELFVPTEAADGEGYTRYVGRAFADVVAAASRIPCTTDLALAAEAFLRGRAQPVRRGPVFTVGSIAFETPENLRLLAGLGFDAIEMELSAFFAGAAYHGFDAAAFTYVSDLPLGSSLWEPKTGSEVEALRSAYRSLPLLCLEFLALTPPGS